MTEEPSILEQLLNQPQPVPWAKNLIWQCDGATYRYVPSENRLYDHSGRPVASVELPSNLNQQQLKLTRMQPGGSASTAAQAVVSAGTTLGRTLIKNRHKRAMWAIMAYIESTPNHRTRFNQQQLNNQPN